MSDLEPTAWVTAGGLAAAGILKLLEKFGWRKLDQADAIRAELRSDVERLSGLIEKLRAEHKADVMAMEGRFETEMAVLRTDVEYWRNLYYEEHDRYLRLAIANGAPSVVAGMGTGAGTGTEGL